MATKKKARGTSKNGFGMIGKEKPFKYRSAHAKGKVTGVARQGNSRATTSFSVMPDKRFRHPGEKLPIHRLGDKLY